jgi:hypothetical protein
MAKAAIAAGTENVLWFIESVPLFSLGEEASGKIDIAIGARSTPSPCRKRDEVTKNIDVGAVP